MKPRILLQFARYGANWIKTPTESNAVDLLSASLILFVFLHGVINSTIL